MILKCGVIWTVLGLLPLELTLYCTFRLEEPVQVPAMHTLGESQSALLVHDVLHAFAPLSQTNGEQPDVGCVRHAPKPLQERAGVSVVPVHDAGAQSVPMA